MCGTSFGRRQPGFPFRWVCHLYITNASSSIHTLLLVLLLLFPIPRKRTLMDTQMKHQLSSWAFSIFQQAQAWLFTWSQFLPLALPSPFLLPATWVPAPKSGMLKMSVCTVICSVKSLAEGYRISDVTSRRDGLGRAREELGQREEAT